MSEPETIVSGVTQRDVEIDVFLRACSERELRQMYEQINQLLATDFVPLLPADIVDTIFGCLSSDDLLSCAKVSKQWRKFVDRETLWAKLCRRRQWSPRQNDFDGSWRRLFKECTMLNRVWCSGEYTAETSLFLHRNRVETLATGGHGDIIATGDKSGRLTLAKVIGENLAIEHQLDLGASINSVKVTGFWAIAGCVDSSCRIVNINTGNQLARFEHPSPVDEVQVCSASEHLLLLGGRHYTVIELRDGIAKFVNQFERDMEASSASTTRGMTIVTYWNGSIVKISLLNGRHRILHAESDDAVICSDTDQSRAVTGGSGGSVMGWDLTNEQLLFHATDGGANDVYAVACHNEHIASADCGGAIRLWAWTGQLKRVLTEHVGAVRTLAYHPNFDVLVSAGDAKFLCVWCAISGRLVKRLIKNNTKIHQMALNTKHIVLAGPSNPGKLVAYQFDVPQHSTFND